MISERSTDTPPHANIPRLTSDGPRINIFCQQSTSIAACQPTKDFFLQPPRSTYKTLFLGSKLEEILNTMSFEISVLEGLKLLECERGVGGKNSPIQYIPKKDPVQEAFEKSKKTNYFKLTLLNTSSELKVALWASAGLPSSLFCMCAQLFMHANKWSMMSSH